MDELDDYLLQHVEAGETPNEVVHAAFKRFPSVTDDEMFAAVNRVRQRLVDEGTRMHAEADLLDRLGAIVQRHGWSENPHLGLGEMLRRAVAAGDAEAAVLVAIHWRD